MRDVIGLFEAALRPDYIGLGGGNNDELKELPANVKLGDNGNAFAGGFRLWQQDRICGSKLQTHAAAQPS